MLPRAVIKKLINVPINNRQSVNNINIKKPEIHLLLDIIKRKIGYRRGTKPLGDALVKMALIQRLCEYFEVHLVGEENRVELFNYMEGIKVIASKSEFHDFRIRSGGGSGMHIIKRLGRKYIPQINKKFKIDLDTHIDSVPPKFILPHNDAYKWDIAINASTAGPKQYEKWDAITDFITSCGLTYKFVDDFEEFNLIQLAQVVNQSKFYIGLDSGVTHLAAACRIPGLILFSTYYMKNKWHYPDYHNYLQFRPNKSYMTLDSKIINYRLKELFRINCLL